MPDEREMNLTEWCAKLPDFHAVNRELRALRWRDEHLLRAWWQRRMRALKRFWSEVRRKC